MFKSLQTHLILNYFLKPHKGDETLTKQFKLGKLPFKSDKRDLKYNDYKATQLPQIPSTFGHENLVQNWQMLGNGPDDSVFPGFQGAGDCTCAGSDHEIMLWTTEGSTIAQFSGANTISDYSAITGYDPQTGENDNGAQVRDVLSYRQQTGMIDAKGKRHKIGAYLQLDQTNLNEVFEACYLFSAVGIGIEVPDSAMDQFNRGEPWTVVKGAQIEGGHYILIVGYDKNYIYVVTWGQVQKMDYKFFAKYCDEAWAILSVEFINSRGVSPEGFNLPQLQTDLNQITNVPNLSITPTVA